VRKVFRSPLLSGPSTLATYLGQLVGVARVVSLLDTSTLVGFAEKTFAAGGGRPAAPSPRQLRNVRCA
jgi:hypothetical protein